MLDPVVAAVRRARAAWGDHPAVLVDCTLGGGGHAEALLAAWPGARLVGLDRDPAAIRHVRQRLAGEAARACLVEAAFGELGDCLVAAEVPAGGVALVLADLGVSSHQLDTAERGFAWRHEAPLDMRMGADGPTAAELIDSLEPRALGQLIARLGEERHARPIARAILRHRPATTGALAEVVAAAVPRGPPSRRHPATRTFQALRMAVNDELGQLAALLPQLARWVGAGGEVALIAFHSLEDRMVRDQLAEDAHGCLCPVRLGVCRCGLLPLWQLPRPRLARPAAAEVAENPRARSARLRTAQRTAAPAPAPPRGAGRRR